MLRIVQIFFSLALVALLFREKPANIIHILRLLAIIMAVLVTVPYIRIEGFENPLPTGSAGPLPNPQTYSGGVGQLNEDISRQAGTYAYDPHFIRGD